MPPAKKGLAALRLPRQGRSLRKPYYAPPPERHANFLERLWRVLDEESDLVSECMFWSSDGSAIVITSDDELLRTVCPEMGISLTSVSSFSKQMNNWHFHRLPIQSIQLFIRSDKALRHLRPDSVRIWQHDTLTRSSTQAEVRNINRRPDGQAKKARAVAQRAMKDRSASLASPVSSVLQTPSLPSEPPEGEVPLAVADQPSGLMVDCQIAEMERPTGYVFVGEAEHSECDSTNDARMRLHTPASVFDSFPNTPVFNGMAQLPEQQRKVFIDEQSALYGLGIYESNVWQTAIASPLQVGPRSPLDLYVPSSSSARPSTFAQQSPFYSLSFERPHSVLHGIEYGTSFVRRPPCPTVAPHVVYGAADTPYAYLPPPPPQQQDVPLPPPRIEHGLFDEMYEAEQQRHGSAHGHTKPVQRYESLLVAGAWDGV